MITEPVWRHAIEMLAARYQREIPTVLAAVYLEQLAAELDDDGLIAGIKGVIRHREYFPTVQQILDAARDATKGSTGDPEVRGRLIFHDMLDTPSGYTPEGGSFWSAAAIRSRYGSAAERAFNAIGGSVQLKRCSDATAPFLARDFAQAYADAVALERAGLAHMGLQPPRTKTRINRGPEPVGKLLAMGGDER